MLDKAGEEQVLNLNRMEARHFHQTKKQALEVCLLCPYKRLGKQLRRKIREYFETLSTSQQTQGKRAETRVQAE